MTGWRPWHDAAYWAHDQRELDAGKTLAWWERIKPAGPWIFAGTLGFGPNMTWGAHVAVMVVAYGARIEEPDEVRLARAYLRHKYPPPPGGRKNG